ncbi:MAG TPA: DUF6644 family protein [Rhizobiaceae bacterium]|nr:DUF6644 family protein [Rhizobiaceae bacterium]
MRSFAEWIGGTGLSVLLRETEWVVPTLQSIHLMGVGVVLASLFMITLRIFTLTGQDQSLSATTRRFIPWLWGALGVLFATGTGLIITEPTRELLSVSFWLKMLLLVVGSGFVLAFQTGLRRHEGGWEEGARRGRSVKAMAATTFAVWCGILLMGRLIAFDAQFWGGLSQQAASHVAN